LTWPDCPESLVVNTGHPGFTDFVKESASKSIRCDNVIRGYPTSNHLAQILADFSLIAF